MTKSIYIVIVVLAMVLLAYDLGFRRARKKYKIDTVLHIDPETGQAHLMLQKGQRCWFTWDPEPSLDITKTGDPGPLKAKIVAEFVIGEPGETQ